MGYKFVSFRTQVHWLGAPGPLIVGNLVLATPLLSPERASEPIVEEYYWALNGEHYSEQHVEEVASQAPSAWFTIRLYFRESKSIK